MTQEKNEHQGNDVAQMASMLMEYVQKGVMLKDIEGVSNESMEEMYACAYHFYRENKLDEAENLFKMLCMYDLNNADYVIGLGAVHQIKKNYQRACDFYALAHVMAVNDLHPMFYGGQCNLLMGNTAKALQCFDMVISNSQDDTLVTKARVYMDTIKSNRPEFREK
ncbi:SycD/LcrH family type III secretion system chaperone (plasmid) [Pantoea sp. BJ2]|uniref:SycD/LcrH family type III secretion system chaperone n=1 Tax=Pantoea sp. BJ2 TaxID=3141322 RepID=A0AAU7U473_9GAMM